MNLMRQILPAAGILALVATALPTAGAATAPALVQSLDLDGDASLDLAVAWNQNLWVQHGAGSPGAAWQAVPLSAHAWPDTERVHAADLNQDGLDDLVLISTGANRVLVVFGSRDRSGIGQVRSFPFPGGPSAADAAPAPDGTPGPVFAGIALETPVPYFAVLSRPKGTLVNDPFALTADRSPLPEGTAAGDASLALALFPESAGVTWHGWLHQAPGTAEATSAPSFTWHRQSVGVAGIRKATDVTLKRGVIGAFPSWIPDDLQPTPVVVAHGPGLGSIIILRIPTDPERPPAVEEIPLSYTHIAWHPRAGSPFNGRLLVARDLEREMSIYRWTRDAKLELEERITPPQNRDFGGTAAWTDRGLAALLLPGSPTQPPSIGWYESRDGRLTFQSETTLPEPARRSGHARLLVYDRNPFEAAQALELAGLAAGDWTRGAEIRNGSVTVQTSTFRDGRTGLQPSASQPIVLPVPVPGGAYALPNQWEPASSLHFERQPGASGNAAVLPQPAPGSHARPISLTFASAPRITVNARINDGPWQTGAGPYPLERSATVSFYGVDASGIAGPRETVRYTIQAASFMPAEPVLADRDKDGLADAWEHRFFGDLAAGPDDDTDQDGATNAAEERAGTNPLDPAHKPDTDPVSTKPRSIEWALAPGGGLVLRWDAPLGLRVGVETSDDMVRWELSPRTPESSPGYQQWTDTDPAQGMRFYRVVRLP